MSKIIDIESYTEELYRQYAVQREGMSVNFRKILPFLNGIERYSHTIHPYPAKLISHIPFFFLNNRHFIKPGEIVLDPFCGSGTTLLEANLIGIDAYGADANPLARLISNCKTKKYDLVLLRKYLSQVLISAPYVNTEVVPRFKNIDIWFSDRVQKELAKLYVAINEIRKGKYRDFFLLCFSVTLSKTSYTDPRVAVPVRVNTSRYEEGSKGWKNAHDLLNRVDRIDVNETFQSICLANIKRMATLEQVNPFGKTRIISKDARYLTKMITGRQLIPDESVDMILTSPPYASAQKYIRSSSLSLYWLKLLEGGTIVDLDSKNIGRENFCKSLIRIEKVGVRAADDIIEKIFEKNKLRGQIACSYLLEMEKALDESVRVLKRGGHMVLIIGNNNVCGYRFNTKQYLSEYLVTKNMQLELELIDDIKSYGLMTKRNKTADIITREWILVFKKM